MHPLSPLATGRESEPNVELLRRNGWSVSMVSGKYCSVWRERDHAIFEWREAHWERVGGGPAAEL